MHEECLFYLKEKGSPNTQTTRKISFFCRFSVLWYFSGTLSDSIHTERERSTHTQTSIKSELNNISRRKKSYYFFLDASNVFSIQQSKLASQQRACVDLTIALLYLLCWMLLVVRICFFFFFQIFSTGKFFPPNKCWLDKFRYERK